MADWRAGVAADQQAVAGDRAVLAGHLDAGEFADLLIVDEEGHVPGEEIRLQRFVFGVKCTLKRCAPLGALPAEATSNSCIFR